MYTPDRVFTRELKQLDSKLHAEFHQQTQRWRIYRMIPKAFRYATDEGTIVHLKDWKYHIMAVVNEDGSYRPLDRRTILELHRRDTIHRDRVRMALDLEEKQENEKKSKKRDRMNKSEDLWKDKYNEVFDIHQSGWTPKTETAQCLS